MSNPKILIIDDDPRYLELLSFTFDGSGVDVIAMTEPMDVVAYAEAHRPDLIMSDISMPRMDGFDLALALRSNPMTADIPVMFLTARHQEIDKCEGQHVGAVEYLTKPFSPADLVATVRRILSRRRDEQNQPDTIRR